MNIPQPAKERLLQLMRMCEKLILAGEDGPLSSTRAEELTGQPRDTIRKDISCFGGAGGGSSGYDPKRLIPQIKKALGLDRCRKFCVVGLGRLGSACLNFAPAELGEFELAAGFDSSVNRLEILRAEVPLYPVYKMPEVISRFGIEIALLCVPVDAAQAAAEKCAAAGIKGILNFAPTALRLPQGIAARNVYVTDELRALSLQIVNMKE